MGDWQSLINLIRQFNQERDWGQFHNAKDLALALSIEAGELNELFLWKNAEEADQERVKEELADIFTYAIQLADKYDFDINEIVSRKIQNNALKYPVEKARGSAKKYNDL
ncbi:nucleotide pyrophosphohydrolase [Chitinophaga qingshengii]|uniref:Nucleotide pyrophosphohydrolase n=1 Tax=Chitinophaga qingshengii TaxID=1569794 RepID=A0ABR7TJX7_9BACT|nr:nucleotide pyrophosphohydrolase [Chitinophaga qingshengii]MBC9930300.1 nucleotide pyrophosphohydrolase [Chitinophaga qingshengii]